MSPSVSPRTAYLHVGASKTGTSSLQRGLFGSAAALEQQGVGVPLGGRPAHVEQVLRPLGWQTSRGFVDPVDPRALSRLSRRLRRHEGERLLLTCEDLCEADQARIQILEDVLGSAGVRPHVVLTLRGLASVVPSEWQQFLKHRMDLSYPTFLERVRDRKGRWARHFWQRQDVVEICERWSEVVGADRLDVIVTPSRSRDPEGLYRLFGAVVGFDPATMAWPQRDVNASWGYVEAEVYRRVNAALDGRLRNYERAYQPAVRWPLVKGVLPRGASARIPLPPEHLPWVQETAEAHVAFLEGSGIRVHGDAKDLLPGPDLAAPLPEVSEEQVAAAAVEALASFAVHAHRRDRHGPTPHQDD
ncbi:hypothetical protein ACFP3Q_12430 [Nocardioides sp. GCM10027113]|uniref:hypothetical protein n=1 Tax=unclassified Nocardioides TaxID=2615069 RepID=UPI0036234730